MRYKSMMLELLEEHPVLHDQLRRDRTLLSTMETWAVNLRDQHLSWIEMLRLKHPAGDPTQRASEALELAVRDIRDRLRVEFSLSEREPQADE